MKKHTISAPDTLTLTPIAHIHTAFPEKFGIPRQSGLVSSLQASITFEGECKNPDCIRDLQSFSHLWLIWGFSAHKKSGWSPTVRPPRLGGNVHTGVFASRSPFRPNPLGLSSVRLDRVDLQDPRGPVLYISGADLMDGTPIYDIKPYLAFTDSHPDASASFTAQALRHTLSVHCDQAFLSLLSPKRQEALLEVLSLDPRPAYQSDPARIYGMSFDQFTIRFTVDGQDLYVREILPGR